MDAGRVGKLPVSRPTARTAARRGALLPEPASDADARRLEGGVIAAAVGVPLPRRAAGAAAGQVPAAHRLDRYLSRSASSPLLSAWAAPCFFSSLCFVNTSSS